MAPASYLSAEKIEELKNELLELSTTRRKSIAESLDYAKSLGDLSENAEYHQAREDQAANEDRIRVIDAMLRDAVVVTEQHGNTIEVGSSAEVKALQDSRTFRWTLVGSQEANVADGKISNESPMGKAMLGKKKGDAFTFRTPTGINVEYKVLSVG